MTNNTINEVSSTACVNASAGSTSQTVTPTTSPTLKGNSMSPEIQRELSLKSLELRRKDDEINHLKNVIDLLQQQYAQELSICCQYSDSLAKLQKELQTLRGENMSKEEQYKKQIGDLQQKLYTSVKI
ncbi:hypothetical protein SAMD00019534_007430 [Acytostelium subglobosum LB1]|uniref:hypothetical protein n=1 Tax=Acytostelium subglobosum LB1 TaxID=1410327 RepID=UPI000644E8C1|nr:hypothetical protein SAMD00019534_007430 [Acytostelium subglobosum LB1]GAM17568.1 hypothetical protein SAMD00019534_007430 [Acytostelium subglobosum LB1]|eukprot:XP_012759630.1 hypothetical protein SAMD00019534_007430 [Acytostelium subglobosum LB1]